MTPFFSIIIPTYNRSLLISRALESVIAQKYKSWEVIVIDNCSTDNTKEVVTEYVNNFPNIHYHFINRKGVSIARNYGIEKSLGKYICFLDDDDEYLDSYLSVLSSAITENKDIPALYKTFAIDHFGSYSVKHDLNCKDVTDNNLHYLLDNVVYVNNVCIHRAILSDLRFDETLKVVEDYHLWLRIVAQYPLYCLPYHTSICYKSVNSVSSGSVKTYYEYIKSYKYVFSDEIIRANTNKSYFRRAVAKNYLWLMMAFAAEKKLLRTILSYLNHILWARKIINTTTFLAHLKRIFA